MEKHLIFLLVECILLINSTRAQRQSYTDDYCWREYNGILPSDAFVAGQDTNNKPIYLGQVLYADKIIPGKILTNDDKIYYEYYNTEFSTKDNVKILCTSKPNRFEWIPTRHVDALNLLHNRILIKGGFEQNCATYLGRLQTSTEINVGKVMCCNAITHCYGLYITKDGKGQLQEVFQILAYNQQGAFSDDSLSNNTEFCWKDYYGTVPSDALETGIDKNGAPLYVGQTLYGDKIIPGKITGKDNKILFEYFSKEYGSTENIKILCATKNVEWIQTRHTDVRNLIQQGKQLIKGGFEPNCQSYIGRVNVNGVTKPGKVICCNPDGSCYGLYTTNEDNSTALYETFDILSVNARNNNYEPSFDLSSSSDDSSPLTTKQKCKDIHVKIYN